MREGALEILALLLLGFIAMLAIVPPIIRGKLEDSPLVTTQTFRRSMEEIGHSLEPRLGTCCGSREPRSGGSPAGVSRTADPAAAGGGLRTVRSVSGPASARLSTAHGRPGRSAARSPQRRAAVRRNRIFAFLTIFALCWGMATLLTGSIWCLALFSVSGFLLALYWGLTIIVPYAYMRSAEASGESLSSRAVRRRSIACG